MSNCSPQIMTFNPRSKDTIASLERKSCLIKRRQRADQSVNGYPVVEQDAILYHYHWIVQRLLDESGLTSEEQEEHILKHLRILIDCVHLIPASGKHHHRTMGGLFEHSVECAVFAVEEIKVSRIFKRTSIESGKIPASRWILAAILCALFHDLGKVVADAQIHNEDRSEQYNPDTHKLLDWAREKIGEGNSYFVSWRPSPREHEVILASILKSQNIIDDNTYKWLGRTVSKEVRHFFNNSGSALRSSVIRADRKSIKCCMIRGQYLRTSMKFFNLDRVNFFEAAKQLRFYGTQYQEYGEAKGFVERGVSIKGWTIDTPNSALISSKEGLYIVFDQLRQVRSAFELDNVQSSVFNLRKKTAELSDSELDSELERLVNHLKEVGCLSSCAGSPYWYVRRINSETGQPCGKPVKTIRLSPLATKLIFDYKEPLIPDYSLISVEYKGEKNSDGSIKGFSTK